MDSHHVAVIDGPAWRMVVVWGLRALVLLPVPITAIYVVKSQLAYGVKDVCICLNDYYNCVLAIHKLIFRGADMPPCVIIQKSVLTLVSLLLQKVASSLQSSREWGDWGPQDPIEHHNWRRWREDETRPITSLKRRFANRPLTYTHSTLSSESSSTLTRLRNKYQRNGTASVLWPQWSKYFTNIYPYFFYFSLPSQFSCCWLLTFSFLCYFFCSTSYMYVASMLLYCMCSFHFLFICVVFVQWLFCFIVPFCQIVCICVEFYAFLSCLFMSFVWDDRYIQNLLQFFVFEVEGEKGSLVSLNICFLHGTLMSKLYKRK